MTIYFYFKTDACSWLSNFSPRGSNWAAGIGPPSNTTSNSVLYLVILPSAPYVDADLGTDGRRHVLRESPFIQNLAV